MSRNQQIYLRFAKITLAIVYLVIIAGAIVRMTGSGMGCPDWPKCFGYYIPPTDEATLLWQQNKEYQKGQVIIRQESLWLATHDFTSSSAFEESHWEPYTRHDYAEFNVYHTWTEYINRLIGAVSGLAMLILLVLSLAYWKKDRGIFWFTLLGLVLLLFQAWLGATVVYSVLAPVRITIHMVMALVIVALLIYLIHRAGPSPDHPAVDQRTNYLWVGVIGLTLFQIILGTQVRQWVDLQADLFGYLQKDQWLGDPALVFYIHRSFSILLLLLHILVSYRLWGAGWKTNQLRMIHVLMALAIGSGIAMNYFAFPFGSQAIHLVVAALIIGLQFAIFLQLRTARLRQISL